MQSFREKSIEVNHLLISYLDEGPENAPVILFIHGFPLNKSMWKSQFAALRDEYRVMAYDVRGHGSSSLGTTEFSIELLVRDLIAFLDALKIDKVLLCGLSMGGYVALNAMRAFSHRFSALILCDTNCIADTDESKEKRKKAIQSIKEQGVQPYAEESVKKLFAPGSFTSRKQEINAVKEMIMNTALQSLIWTLHALANRPETCSILPSIKVPVMIVVGQEDVITPPSAAILMHEQIKGSVLAILPQAGHLSNMENTPEFNTQLKGFISKI